MAKKKKDSSPAAAGAHTFKLIDLVGTSPESYEDAIRQAVKDASRTVKGISWFEVSELRGSVTDGKVSEYQATVKLGFRVQHRDRD